MTLLDQKSSLPVAVLVEFSYETPTTTVRYAVTESDVTFQGNTFSSQPLMQIDLPKITGSPEAAQAEITMSEVAPIDKMRSTFPPVSVTIWEINPGDDDSAYILYKGKISKCKYNHNGVPGQALVTVAGPKKGIESSVSVPLSQFCPWTYGSDSKGPCKRDRESDKDTATVTAIDGNRVTLTGASTLDPDLFKHGSVRFNGFEVAIHFQESLTTLYTVKPVPSHWLNETIDILSGCDKTSGTCESRGQLENFGGIGLKIPNVDIRISS